jgi:hypothetical protein
MCGLCVVCGQPPPPTPDPAAAESGGDAHPRQTAADPSSAAPQQQRHQQQPQLALRHLHASRALVVSAEEAERVSEASGRALLRSRRLVLALDLDHTLVNTARWGDLTPAERAAARALLARQAEAQRAWEGEVAAAAAAAAAATAEEEEEAGAGQGGEKKGGGEAPRPLPPKTQRPPADQSRPPPPPAPQHDVFALGGANFALVTKVRPGARALLRSLSRLYELHVYTMGDRSYADLVAGLLDPDGSLLGGGGGGGGAAGAGAAAAGGGAPNYNTGSSARVISAGDSSTRGSKDLDVLLASERRCVVLDDTEAVWSERARLNVVAVPRYHWWGESRRAWDRERGKGLLEAGLEASGLATSDGRVALEDGEEEGEEEEEEGALGGERGGGELFGGGGGGGDDEVEAEQRRRRRRRQEKQRERDARLCAAARAADEPGVAEDDSDRHPTSPAPSPAAPMAVALRVLRDVHAAFFADVDGGNGGGGQAPPQQKQQQHDAPRPPPPPQLLTPAQVDRLAASGDVRAALRDVRARALAGCRVVFSGLWPTSCDPCAQPRWRLAEALGADCSTRYVAPPKGGGPAPAAAAGAAAADAAAATAAAAAAAAAATTHVVAAPPGQTEKAVRASRDAFARVVHPDWLAACGFLWARADERGYLLAGGYGGSRDVGHHHLHGMGDATAAANRGRAAAARPRGGGRADDGGGADADEEERERRTALAAAAGGGSGGAPG